MRGGTLNSLGYPPNPILPLSYYERKGFNVSGINFRLYCKRQEISRQKESRKILKKGKQRC